MAETSVKSAVNLLGKLLIEEAKHLQGAEEKIEELRNELLWMQSFLRDADANQYDDELVRTWVSQIKEYVCEAEDVIDEFVIKVASHRGQFGWMNNLKRCFCCLRECIALHQVASRIDLLKTRIMTLSPRLEKYGLNTSHGMKTYRTQEAQMEQAHQYRRYRHLENDKTFGLEKNTQEIVDALSNSKPSVRSVVAIHGMGGLGKTTLARKVFNHVQIGEDFHGGRAWAYISKQFQVRSVLQVVLSDLTKKHNEIYPKQEKELIFDLQEFLKNNKCLVVLDDVWGQAAWDSLKVAFASCGGESGSKVFLTTRKKEVAEYVDEHALRKPDYLDSEESWKLLQHTVGWLKEEEGVHQSSQTNHDLAMLELGKEMVDRCNGLPLAIIALGGILRKRATLDEWRIVQKNMNPFLRRGYDHGRSCTEILLQSYNDLPYDIKPCLLHLGNFPEDHEIRTEKLYRMWVAEGLVSWSNDRALGAGSLEDVANDIMSELAQAGLVIVLKKRPNGIIKSVLMHDLMRDVCLQKAEAENFLGVIDHRSCPDRPLGISSYFSHRRSLRMAVYLAKDVNGFVMDSLSSKAHRYLRSLLFIAGHEYRQDDGSSPPDSLISKYVGCLKHLVGEDDRQNKYQDWIGSVCKDFGWLRVLDIEGFCLKGKLTSQIHKLLHLRYLSLQGTEVSELPSSIGKLRFLEILDLRVSFAGSSVKIPNTLWKLNQLRHLFLPSIIYGVKKRKKLRINTLSRLEMLKNLEVSNSRLDDLRKLQKLRKLSVKGIVSEVASLEHILQSPALESGTLQDCSIDLKGVLISENKSILSGYDCIRRLKIVGEVSVHIKHFAFPRFLKVLSLESCGLKEDPMEILGSLSHLKDLFLGMDSYAGEKMNCKSGGFPMLIKLYLRGLVKLEQWTIVEDSMRNLEVLKIWNCVNLESIPDELPSSVHVTCSPCINGIERHRTCIFYNASSLLISTHDEVFRGNVESLDSLKKMLTSDGKHKIIALEGVLGLGKTALAKELCRQQDIKSHFSATAWACVSGRYASGLPRDTLQQLLRDLDPHIHQELLQDSPSLSADVRRVMREKKCLVVLIHPSGFDLARLMVTLYGCDWFEKGSKLLLISPVSLDETGSDKASKLKLPLLTDSDSWDLFSEIAKNPLYGDDGFTKAAMGRRMLKFCSGLPLSTRMIAGLLVRKETLMEWETIYKKITSVKQMNYQDMLKEVFLMCYNDLPSHLKLCFHYLVNFQEDREISTERLYRMWIAAGFVTLKDDGDSEDEFLENLAESYLAELVQRGLVKVWKRKATERIKTCRVQFGLYDMCLSKAREGGHLRISEPDEPLQPSASRTISTVSQYLAVYLNHDVDEIFPASTSSHGQLTSVKSLLYFPEISHLQTVREDWGWFRTICNQYSSSLRVLDLGGMWTAKGRLPSGVGNLTQLRYFSLKGTWVSEIPSSIQRLENLQTLDLRALACVTIPDVLWKLQCLRHLYLPRLVSKQPERLLLRGLHQLQTLTNMNTGIFRLDHVPELKLLTKMTIANIFVVKESVDILNSLGRSLDVSFSSEIIKGGKSILSSLKNLHKVRIKWRIPETVRLQHEMFSVYLEELILKHTKLVEDPIPVLEKLPSLGRIFFDHESFLGNVMNFSGGFRSLSHLRFRLLGNLEELNDPTGEMRELESIVIIDCWRLQKDKVKLQSNDIRMRY